jgi:hypothetical protein
MSRLALSTVLFVALVSALTGQDKASPFLPMVKLSLPTGTASGAVQINYFMGGPFGGYGGYVKQEKGLREYVIEASVEGRAATDIKVIAYLPGCEILTLEIPLQGESVERQLVCKPLPSIALRGQIFPVSITQDQPVEVEVTYLAEWSHRFFGICDGAITTIHVGTVVPDENGKFLVELPDLNRQADLGEGKFELKLRNRTSWNIIARLKPADTSENPYGLLRVRSSYSSLEQFMAETR